MLFLSKVIICLLTYALTYYLNHTKKWGAVLASSTIALIVGGMYQLAIINQFEVEHFKTYGMIMMGATFMGMIGKAHEHKLLDFVISSLIFCTLFQHISSLFDGLGGLLGTIACISVLSVFGIDRILRK